MLSYRRATKNDTLIYFNWANDINVRKQSFNSSEIDLASHKIWFLSKIKDTSCLMLVFQTIDKLLVGQIRIQKENDKEALIGISIDQEHRGKSYASEMLKKASDFFFETNENFKIKALIKTSNLNSKFSFEKAGFIYERTIIVGNVESFLYTKKINENR